MEDLRQSLHGKIDAFLHDVVSREDTSVRLIRIEAVTCYEDEDSPHPDADATLADHREVLYTLDVEEVRKLDVLSTATQRAATTSNMHTENGTVLDSQDKPPSPAVPTTQELAPNSTSTVTRGYANRRAVGGLRLNAIHPEAYTPPRSPSPRPVHQLETADRHFPKRRKVEKHRPAQLEQSTVDRLIEGVWEQIHRPASLASGQELLDAFASAAKQMSTVLHVSHSIASFEDTSRRCQQITSASRTSRVLEVVIQAHWVDRYYDRIAVLKTDRSDLKTVEVKRLVLNEACSLFQWSEKELRNRMSIWKGYRDIKDAAGWAALVFAGPGIYRFCKYRLGFGQDAIVKLQHFKPRFEVAADTIQPQWRELLSLVGEPAKPIWTGHPHDWVVSKRKDPVPLSTTYPEWESNFTFQHLQNSVLDTERWGDRDPRRSRDGPHYTCGDCNGTQSTDAERNECECFPDLLGPSPSTVKPVQIFRTEDGRNNGLVACCKFDRGHVVGEFVGDITKGLSDVDVMQSHVKLTSGQRGEQYQIWQGRRGNYTRFINHSCQPNCQFQTFVWMGMQRILIVSKGVPAGKEITIDYSGKYWQHLKKTCLCGEPKCRYTEKTRFGSNQSRTVT